MLFADGDEIGWFGKFFIVAAIMWWWWERKAKQAIEKVKNNPEAAEKAKNFILKLFGR
jgi:hypothetical protein